jgi:hypothetical protein
MHVLDPLHDLSAQEREAPNKDKANRLANGRFANAARVSGACKQPCSKGVAAANMPGWFDCQETSR